MRYRLWPPPQIGQSEVPAAPGAGAGPRETPAHRTSKVEASAARTATPGRINGRKSRLVATTYYRREHRKVTKPTSAATARSNKPHQQPHLDEVGPMTAVRDSSYVCSTSECNALS